MKSNNGGLVVLTSLGLSLAAFGIGCGDSATSTGSGGSGSGGDGTTSTMVTVGSTGGGGAAGDGNDTIAEADPLEDNMGTLVGQGELDPPDSDVDYWSFAGVAGPTLIYTDAKPSSDGFADGYLDVVVTLFDSDGNQLASNDDPFPRTTQDAQIYTILPAAGTYYVKVEEFCQTTGAGCDASYFSDLTDVGYAVAYLPLDPADPGTIVEATEQNDTFATAAAMEYAPCTATGCVAGDYYTSVAYGEISASGDIDAFKFTVPGDVNFETDSRLNVTFSLLPPGTDGNGSSINPGIVEILDAAGTTVITRFDMSAEPNDTDRAEMTAPLTAGTDYLFRVAGGPTLTGGDPFYFMLHSAGTGNPTEKLDTTNTVISTPEVLTAATAQTSYFVEGNLPTADVDFFSLAVEPGVLSVACGGQRSGSGVRGLKATILKGSDDSQIGTPATETATADLLISEQDVGTETTVKIKIEQGTQDTTVTSDYYRCGFHFAPPAP